MSTNKIFSLTLIFLITLGIGLSNIEAQTDNALPEPGILPDNAFYGLKIAFEGIRTAFTLGKEARLERNLGLSEKRLAELEEITEKGKFEYQEKLMNRYEKRIQRANEIVNGTDEEKREQLRERIFNATSKHIQILNEVYEKVPEQARNAIERAINNSNQIRNSVIEEINDERRKRASEENIEFTEIESKYENGKFSYEFTIQKPTPCHTIEIEEEIDEESRKIESKIVVVFDENEICAQVITPEKIEREIEISEEPLFFEIFINEIPSHIQSKIRSQIQRGK